MPNLRPFWLRSANAAAGGRSTSSGAGSGRSSAAISLAKCRHSFAVVVVSVWSVDQADSFGPLPSAKLICLRINACRAMHKC